MENPVKSPMTEKIEKATRALTYVREDIIKEEETLIDELIKMKEEGFVECGGETRLGKLLDKEDIILDYLNRVNPCPGISFIFREFPISTRDLLGRFMPEPEPGETPDSPAEEGEKPDKDDKDDDLCSSNSFV